MTGRRPIRRRVPDRVRSSIPLALLLPALALAQGTPDVLTLSNATLPPVTRADGRGYLDAVHAELFGRVGLSVELRPMPPARGLVDSNAGLLDGDAARIDLDPAIYPNLIKLPEPVIDVVFAGLHVRADIRIESWADFAAYRVGYVRGWRIAERNLGGHPDAVVVRKPDQMLDMLAAGRIDIAFLTIAPARHLARRRGLEGLRVTGFRVRKALFLYLHSRHRRLIPALGAALRAMKEDGRHDALLADYVRDNR